MGTESGVAENIRVYARVRPPSQADPDGATCWHVEGNALVQQGGPPAGREFALDVFDGGTFTAAVYDAVARPLLPHLLAGFNVTALAYGQTGSGKTHTMHGGGGGGGGGGPPEAGLVPLAVGEVFRLAAACQERHFQLRLSYLEIYNEQLSDLLEPQNSPKLAWDAGLGHFAVAGLRQEAVQSAEQVLALLAAGERRRRRGATAMNAASSRSHTLLRLEVASARRGGVGLEVGEAEEAAACCDRRSLLTLVDLAGSERLAKTGAQGQRMREGAAINASLLALGTVVHQLCEGAEHVSYRNSQLTKVLQPCLGGNAKAAVVCTVNPAAAQAEETANTLRFAERAKRVINVVAANDALPDDQASRRQKRRIEEQAAVIEGQARQPAAQGERIEGQARQLAEQGERIAALEKQVCAAAEQARQLAEQGGQLAALQALLMAATAEAEAAKEEAASAAALRAELERQAARVASLEARLAAEAAEASQASALRGQLAEQAVRVAALEASLAERAAAAGALRSEQAERAGVGPAAAARPAAAAEAEQGEAGLLGEGCEAVQREMEGMQAQLQDAQDEVTRLRAEEQRRQRHGELQRRTAAAAAAPRKRRRGGNQEQEPWEELSRTLQASKLQRREAQRLAAATAALLPVSSRRANKAGRAASGITAPASEGQLQLGAAVLQKIQI